MRDFDGKILSERQIIVARNRDIDNGGLPPPEEIETPEPSGGIPGQGEDGGEVPEPGSGGGYLPPARNKREGDYDHQARRHKPPADVPDGSDDDVLARQLREAAETESDPELRRRLWDEYRRYKEGG